MGQEPINIAQKFALFTEHWSPRIIAQMNDYVFKLAKIQGEFIWHKHLDTDEVFFIIEGHMVIEFRETSVTLNQGEMFVVPRGIEHKPSAEQECHIMLIEPFGTVNTGDVDSDLTTSDTWI
jgi:mannose-6-phosphate isomerase-like protein (cupin superfamily)